MATVPHTSMQLRERSKVPENPKLQKKTPAQASKDHRERLKSDPETYATHRKYENIRVKLFMSKLNDEKRAQYNENTRLRVQKHRAKKKAERGEKVTTKTVTRAGQEKLKAKWRDNKRSQHAHETPEARDRRNARRREMYALKNTQKSLPTQSTPSTEHYSASSTSSTEHLSTTTPQSAYANSSARRKAAQRAREALPKESNKAAEIIEKLVTNATPRKKQLLRDKLILSPKSKTKLKFDRKVLSEFKSTLTSLKKKRTKEANRTRITIALALRKKYSVNQYSSLGIGYKMTRKLSTSSSSTDIFQRKRRKDAVSVSSVELVEAFYRRSDMSRQLPDARGTKRRRNGEIVARRVMERSVVSVHEEFTAEHPECSVGRSLFAALRPDDVLPTTSCRTRDCLCEKCANIELKLEALRLFAAQKKLDNITYKDRYDLSRSTLCPKGDQGEYQRKCLERKCITCGTTAIERQLQPLLELHLQDTINCQKWSTVDEAGKKRTKRVKRTLLVSDFVEELLAETTPFSKHLFDAAWQGRQYELVSRCVEEGTVVVCEDYAENFKTHYQDEAQGAHWSYEQVTLHASVASYACEEDACGLTVTESVIFVSDDTKHDSHAIHHFHGKLMTYLQSQDRPPFHKVIFFSDGAPGQYKNKTAFMDMSCGEEDFGISAERHFFGTRHGKGPCDREFGTLKSAVNRRIKLRGVDIDSAETFFHLVDEKYSHPAPPRGLEDHSHFRRKFFFVRKEDVERDRQRVANLKAIPNTRQQHCTRMISKGVVSFRERSCFCGVCQGKEEGACLNRDQTGDWSVITLLKGRQAQGPLADIEQVGAPADADPVGAPADADPLGAPADDAGPLGAPADADPVGAPDDADPLGAPADADPVGAPADPVGAPVDDADPFGAPADDADPLSAPADDVDPLGAPADDADPLGAPADADPVGAPADTDPVGTPADADPLDAPADAGSLDAYAGAPVDAPADADPIGDRADPVPAPAHAPSLQLTPGAFVRVMVLPASGRREQGKTFVAAVKRVDEEKLHVSFLRRQKDFYSFPQIEDESIVLRDEVEEIMPEPQFDRRGHIFFKGNS